VFKCADTAFTICSSPAASVDAEEAVMVCGALSAAYAQVMEYGLMFEV